MTTGGKKTADAATDRALAAEGRTAHADAEASTPFTLAHGIELEAFSAAGLGRQGMRSAFNPVCLTFDVRGGPLAGRPLDGGVRRIRPNSEMTGTRERNRRRSLT